jgi:signal transduction histidine kinase
MRRSLSASLLVLLSALLAIEPAPASPEEIDAALSESRNLKDREPARALVLARDALELALESNDGWRAAKARVEMARALEILGGYDEALLHTETALEYLRETANWVLYAAALNVRGTVLFHQGHYDDALAAFQRTYAVLDGTDDLAGQADALNAIGRIYDAQNDTERALDYYEQAMARNEAGGDLDGVATQLNNIATLHSQQGDFDRAMAAYERSIRIREQIGNYRDMAATYGNIGVLHFRQADYPGALDWISRALDLHRQVGNRLGEAQALYNIGRIHHAGLGEHEQALARFRESLPMAEDLEALDLLRANYRGMYLVEQDRENFRAALEHLEKAEDIRNQMFNLERQRQIEAMNARFETARKEREIALLQEERRFDAMVRNGAIGGSVLMLILIGVTFNRYRVKARANRAIQKKNDELSTLDSIVAAINSKDDFSNVLSVLLRQTVSFFDNAEKGLVMILDSTSQRFRVASAYGYKASIIANMNLDPMTATSRYTRGGQQIVDGIYLHKSLPPIPGYEEISVTDPHMSLIAMTITINGQVEGFLVLMNSRESAAFRPADAERFLRIREHAISALTRARQMDNLKEENQRAEKAIHQLTAAETELKRALAEAERANATKAEFLARVSHELRTPLNAIIGYSEMLKVSGSPECQTEAEHIRSAGRHLLALIDDILDLSQIEANKVRVAPEELSVSELIDDAVTTMTPQIEKNRNRFLIKYSPAIGNMYSDPVKLRQVLLNLLSNAGKFTSGGEVTLSVERLAGETPGMGDEILFQVADTGIGMSGEQIGRVFDAFAQADISISRKYGGTGLGLSVSRGLCRLMGGDISVESTPGAGSVFIVRLPSRMPSFEAGENEAAGSQMATRES